jgi:hypothetical protein
MNLSDDAQKVVAIARLLRQHAERLIALRCLVNTADEEPMASRLQGRREEPAAALAKNAAIESMVLICSRAALDKPGKDRQNIREAVSLLSEPMVTGLSS